MIINENVLLFGSYDLIINDQANINQCSCQMSGEFEEKNADGKFGGGRFAGSSAFFLSNLYIFKII